MIDTLIQASHLVVQPQVLLIMLASSIYGIVIGAIPGLTAVMAVSLSRLRAPLTAESGTFALPVCFRARGLRFLT